MSTKDYLVIPESFEGFKKEAFDLLQSYKDNPDSEYNKDIFNKYVRNPFKEIQEGLFSCIQEGLSEYNLTDKSARSSHANRANKLHHHFWAAIYRKHRKSKSYDLQYFWYICDNKFKFGLYSGNKTEDLNKKIIEHILKNKDRLKKLTELVVNGHPLKTVIDDTNGFPIDYLEIDNLDKHVEVMLEKGVNFCFEYDIEETLEAGRNIYLDMITGFQLIKPLYIFLLECDKAYSKNNELTNEVSKESEGDNLRIKSLLEFANDLERCNLQFSNQLVIRFISSLISKQFMILTGLSGSGKTKLAQAFASWICDNYDVKEDGLSCSLPVNKSAMEHRGWTLPNNVRMKFINWIDKDVKIKIDNKVLKAQLHNPLQLFYEKDFNLSSNYEIGDKVNVIFQNRIKVKNKQCCLIPVGADWTNREPLLGYPNALETGKYVKPENGVLDLVLNAIENPTKPFFLILDEMNLSHVERYFADFLSAMESEEEIPLHPDSIEWKDENGDWNDGIPASIKLPNNLFIIGTVNIDETTYMFSPKVLDRANVIEFRVTDEELKVFLKNPAKPDLDIIKGKGSGMAADFVKLAKSKTSDFDGSSELNVTLLEFFNELKRTGAEFGYRTVSEIHCFCAKLNLLTKDEDITFEIDDMIDAAILQKLLPKLHGSRKKLEPVLNTLAILCLVDDEKKKLFTTNKDRNQNIGKLVDEAVENEDNIRFKLSMEKILRMKKRVIQDGFTSFAEA